MAEDPLGGAARAALDELRRRIRSGTLAPGAQLPPERTLAAELGIARNTLRRVLTRLEQQGHLTRRIGSGTFVRKAVRDDGDGLRGRLRHASPAELMEVRLIIEPQAAAMAATRASPADLQAIDDALASTLAANGLAEFEHWDAQLHLMIFRGAKNTVLIDYCQAITTIRNEPDWYRLKKRTVTPELRRLYDRHHAEIVTALRNRDPERARQLTTQHLTTVRDNLLGTL